MVDNRIEWIDISKGIGIILVIAGHTFSLGYSFPLYAFHMPLFFFLSGLLFVDKNNCFRDFLRSKTKSLLKPWAVILLLSLLVCIFIPEWRNQITLEAVAADLYTANTNVFQNSSLWYLVCFYFLLLLFYFINKINVTRLGKLSFLLLAVALLWSKELLNLTALPFHRLPFKIDSALIALFFFTLAYWHKESISKFVSAKLSVFLIGLIIIVSASACYLNGWSNINSLDFGRIRLLYYPVALMGVSAVCLASKWLSLSRLTIIRKIFSFYGKNSLIIFGFQSLFIRLYLFSFNKMQGLTMVLYGNNPMEHQIGAFIAVTFILSPILICIFRLIPLRISKY